MARGSAGSKTRVMFYCPTDPGYRDTARMLVEVRYVYMCTRVHVCVRIPRCSPWPSPSPDTDALTYRLAGVLAFFRSLTPYTQMLLSSFPWWLLPGGLGAGVARGRGEERRRVVHARGVPRPPAAAAAAGDGQRPARRLSRTKPAGRPPLPGGATAARPRRAVFLHCCSSAHHVLDNDRGITTDYFLEYYVMQV